jgi:hypothetical protein
VIPAGPDGSTPGNFKTFPASEVSTLMNDAISPTGGPADSMAVINSFIVVEGQAKGVLQLWSEMVSPSVAAGQLDYRSAVDQYTTYYKRLVSAQLLAANVLVEAHNYLNDKGAKGAWDSYKTLVLAQEDEFIQWLVPLVYSGVEAYLSTPPAGPKPVGPLFTYYEASMQLHAGLQAMPGDAAGQGYYAPTSIFEDAEALLSTLSVTDPDDRRIVVHMVFSDDQSGTFKIPIDGQSITIEPPKNSSRDRSRGYLGESNSVKVAPAHTAQFSYSPFPLFFQEGGFSSPDFSFANGSHGEFLYLYRQVYSWSTDAAGAPPDGSYQLTDLNGTLPPMFTYAGGKATNFQETKVLRHSLTVNPTSQVDFMNFGAYMVGQIQ